MALVAFSWTVMTRLQEATAPSRSPRNCFPKRGINSFYFKQSWFPQDQFMILAKSGLHFEFSLQKRLMKKAIFKENKNKFCKKRFTACLRCFFAPFDKSY